MNFWKSLFLALVVFAQPIFSSNAFAQYGDISKAQSGLLKTPLYVKTKAGFVTYTVEIADTLAKQEVGMMWRVSMKSNEGMLFDYMNSPHRAAFWMRNTLIPLDIIYVRDDGTIANVAANAKPLDETPVWSRGIISAVLELKGGEAARMGIKAGDIVVHPIFGNMNIAPKALKKKGK